MSAQDDLPVLLARNGWMPLRDADSSLTYFRWRYTGLGQVREELNVIFDKAGRVYAWSVWHNKRTRGPDQENDRRSRLEGFIELPR